MIMRRCEAGSSGDVWAEPASPAYLLARLGAEYPKLPTEALQRALDQASVAAAALGGGHRLTAALARDRLNLVHERAAAAARRTGRPAGAQDRAESTRAGPKPAADAVPCTYCRAAVPISSFTYWSTTARLLLATCPTCRRQMTVLAAAWRRWTHQPTPSPSAAAGGRFPHSSPSP